MHRVFEFRDGLQAVTSRGLGVFLVGELGSHLLKGELFGDLCPCIDGRRSVAEIAALLAGTRSVAEVLYGVEWLASQGHVAPVPWPADDRVGWALESADPPRLPSGSAPRLRVTSSGGPEPGVLIDGLRRNGFDVGDEGLHVVLVDDYLSDGLAGINRSALQRGERWLPLKLDGVRSWLGPLFESTGGPCWACLATRLRDNRPVQTFLQRRGEWPAARHAASPPDPVTPAMHARHAERAAAVLAWIITGGAAAAGDALPASTLWTVDHRSASIDTHPVSRRPHCAACGSRPVTSDDAQGRVVLQRAPRRGTSDGGQRTATPEQTWQRLRRHVDALTGIVSSIGPLPDRPPLRPVYAASFLVCPVDASPSFDDFHRSSLGKGRTHDQARVSALCEAFERWSAIARGDEPRRLASACELRDDAVPLDRLLGFSARQYADRAAWNGALADVRRHVPEPCPPDRVIEWAPA